LLVSLTACKACHEFDPIFGGRRCFALLSFAPLFFEFAPMFAKTMTIAGFDPELAQAIAAEDQRQEDHVELIASENYASPRVMEAQGSQMTNKYAEALLRWL
jgi:hypothetical protein